MAYSVRIYSVPVGAVAPQLRGCMGINNIFQMCKVHNVDYYLQVLRISAAFGVQPSLPIKVFDKTVIFPQ